MIVALSRPAYQRVDYNHVPIQSAVGGVGPGEQACQPHEPLPAGTRALRIYIAKARPPVRARVTLSGPGGRDGPAGPARIAAGPSVVAPLAHAVRRDRVAIVCLVNAGPSPIVLAGAATGAVDQIVLRHRGAADSHLLGRARIDDLVGPGPVPAWDIASAWPERVATATGTSLAPWLAGLGLLLAFLSALFVLRMPARASTRTEILAIIALAIGSGGLWAGLTPALQKTDETAHFAYVQAFSELGHPPRQFADTGLLSGEFTCWYNGLAVASYRFLRAERPPWASAVRRSLDHQCRHFSRRYDGAMYHAFQPPLYYGLGSVAYLSAYNLPLPTRLVLVRMVSVLIAAAFVAFCYLLVRELVPATRWPARSAAFALALQPIVMFNLSGVNPDGLYAAASAAVAWLAARAWRRGISWRLALCLGVAIGVGVLSKTNFLGVLPAVFVLLASLAWGVHRNWPAQGARLLAGLAVAAALFGVYALVNSQVWHRGLTYRPPAFGGSGGSLSRLLSFSWQFFFPRLPGMHPLVAGYLPIWHDFVRGILVRLGWWDDYGMARIFEPLLLAGGLVLAIGAVSYLVPRVRRRPWPFVVAAVCGLVTLLALVFSDYEFSLNGSGDQMEGRYLLPLLPLWALLVGCGVGALRARWRPSATAVLAACFLAYTVAAAVTTVSRFYL